MYNDVESRRKLPKSVVEELRQRAGNWFIETYLSPAEFHYALDKMSHWAYIYHDRDYKDDGTLKEPHYHIVARYSNFRTGFAVLKDFVGNQNSFCEKCKSLQASYDYLTHKNEPDKTLYDDIEIVHHNPVYWESFIPSVRDRTSLDLVEDLLSESALDLREMAKKYGRDFIKNYKAYLDFRETVKYHPKHYI